MGSFSPPANLNVSYCLTSFPVIVGFLGHLNIFSPSKVPAIHISSLANTVNVPVHVATILVSFTLVTVIVFMNVDPLYISYIFAPVLVSGVAEGLDDEEDDGDMDEDGENERLADALGDIDAEVEEDGEKDADGLIDGTFISGVHVPEVVNVQ